MRKKVWIVLLKVVFAGVLLIALLITSFATSFALVPQLVLNDYTARLAMRVARVVGLKLTAENVKLNAWNVDVFTKHIEFASQNLCFELSDQSLQTCLNNINFILELRLERPAIRIYRIDRLLVNAKSFRLNIADSSASGSRSSFRLGDYFPKDIEQLHVGDVGIDAHSVDVRSGLFHSDGELYLKLDPIETQSGREVAKRNGQFGFDLHETSGKDSQSIGMRSSLTFITQGFGHDKPLDILGDLDVATSTTQPARVHLISHLFKHAEEFDARVKVEKACLDHLSIPLFGCVKNLDVGINGIFSSEKFEITSFAPVKFQSSSLKFHSVNQAPADSGALLYESVHSAFTQIFGYHLHDVDVKVDDFELIRDADHTVQIRASTLLKEKDGIFNVAANVGLPMSHATATAHLDLHQVDDQVRIAGDVAFRNPNLQIVSPLSALLDPRSGKFGLMPQLHVPTSHLDASANIVGIWNNQKWNVTFEHVSMIKSKIVEVKIGSDQRCGLELFSDQSATVDCRLEVRPLIASMGEYVGDVPFVIRMAVKPEGPSAWTGGVSLDTQAFKNELIEGRIQSDITFHGLNLGESVASQLHVKNNIRLRLAHFQTWVKRTRTTLFAVPAPLNALDGSIELESVSTVQSQNAQLPVQIRTDLHGPAQSMVTTTDLQISLTDAAGKLQPSFAGKSVMKDVALALPRFKLATPPPLMADSRITVSKSPIVVIEKPDSTSVDGRAVTVPSTLAPGIKYEIEVIAEEAHPVHILLNLADKPIPLAFDLHLSSGRGVRGIVTVLEFPATLFKRRADLKYFKFDIHSDRSDENPIDGHIEVNSNDYKIFIDLSGTMKNPSVKLGSDPFLSDSQIISVLLFNKSINDLDPEQSNSTQGVQSAMGDRALGLFSLYYLAATPVESVGYNSQQKVFTAKVRLREGLSLDIGANQSDVKEIGLNKRLGGSWMIRTYVSNPNDTNNQSVTAFLEKLFRY